MEIIKILLVEDSQSDIEIYDTTIKVYERKNKVKIETVYAKTIDQSLELIDSSFDGAIVDLKLDQAGDEGNYVVDEIMKKFRIPILVFTGTPENLNTQSAAIPVHKKGEISYEGLIDLLFNIYKTGLTKIMGGRGSIEHRMNVVFWNNILPTISSWSKISNSQNTEEALLRYTISHLLELLNNNSEFSFPEEAYIYPPISADIKPGSIVYDEKKEPHIVLSPACDLVKHGTSFKTDRVLVAHIENFEDRFGATIKKCRLEPKDDNEKKEKEKAENQLNGVIRNSMYMYYHYLPKSDFFGGGIVNFRKINTYKTKDYFAKFTAPEVQVSHHFIKDIVGRFSSFYSRQGQPDFDFDEIFSKLKENF